MGGRKRVNDGTEGHCFSFTLLSAIHQQSQHVSQLILGSITHFLFTICFTHLIKKNFYVLTHIRVDRSLWDAYYDPLHLCGFFFFFSLSQELQRIMWCGALRATAAPSSRIVSKCSPEFAWSEGTVHLLRCVWGALGGGCTSPLQAESGVICLNRDTAINLSCPLSFCPEWNQHSTSG